MCTTMVVMLARHGASRSPVTDTDCAAEQPLTVSIVENW